MAAAGNRLNDKHSKSRALVLLTDGDNNAGRIPPNTAAEALKALHIKLYAVGIGTNGVAPFPVMDGRTGQVITDAVGNVLYQSIPVSFNEAGLKEVARIADGQFYRATDTKSLESIFKDIDKMEKSTVSVKKYQQYRDLFPLCIMSGCGLLLGQILLSQTIWRKLP
jgi:Ca-activated chloride channel homolog